MESTSKASLDYKMAKEAGIPWNDPDFTESKSLFGAGVPQGLVWTRYSQRCSGLLSVISPDDVRQGDLGDCYFVSAMAAAAQVPDRISRLFVTKSLDPALGAYMLRVWVNGAEQEVLVDDCVPINPISGLPAFVKSQSQQLWVILLEKCWAKVCGSYQNIIKGTAAEAFRFLTGAPCDRLEHDEFSPEQMWAQLVLAIRSQHIVCGSAGNSESNVDKMCEAAGLTWNHGYSLLGSSELTLPSGKTERLLLLKNPLGSTRWRGDWWKGSPKWAPSLISQLPGGRLLSEDTGAFYMSVADYLRYFRATYICRESKGLVCSSLTCPMPPSGDTPTVVRIRLDSPAKSSVFTVCQAGQRFVRMVDPNYAPRRVHAVLGRLGANPGEIEYLDGGLGGQEDVSVSPPTELSPGEYVMYIELDPCGTSSAQTPESSKFVFSVYSETRAALTADSALDEAAANKILADMMRSCAKKLSEPKDYSEHGDPAIIKYSAINDSKAGFGYIYYVNNSHKNALYELLTFTKMKGVALKKSPGAKGFLSDTQFEVTIPPSGEHIVVLKKTDKDSQISTKQRIGITASAAGAGTGAREETKGVVLASAGTVVSAETKTILEKGKCKQVGKSDIYIYEYKEPSSSGFALLFQNRNKTKAYACGFEFQFSNLSFADGTAAKFIVRLAANECAVKSLKIIKPGKFGYSFKSSINEAAGSSAAPAAAAVKKPAGRLTSKTEAKKLPARKPGLAAVKRVVNVTSAKKALNDVIDMYKDLA